MPPKTAKPKQKPADTDASGSETGDETPLDVEAFVKAILDPRVINALNKAMGPSIARLIQDGIQLHLAPVIASVTTFKTDLARLSTEHADLSSTVLSVEATNKRLSAQVLELHTRLEDQEIYSRAHDIIIRGIPEAGQTYASVAADAQSSGSVLHDSTPSLEFSILQLFNDTLDVAVEPRDIVVAHRLRKGKTDVHRPIIVRFSSRKVRDAVLRAKSKLYVPGSKKVPADCIFIGEHLTTGVAKLFYEARRLVKAKKLASAWTRNGLVNCKFTENVAEKFTVARCLADLSHPRVI